MNHNKTDRPPLSDAVRSLAREQYQAFHFVPTEEGLVAFHAGELSPEEEDLVRAYLAVTPEAAEFVADLDAFLADAEDEEQHLSEHESARVVGALESKLEEHQKPTPAVPATASTGPSTGLAPFGGRGLAAAAAVLFVVAGVSLIWGAQQRARVGGVEARNADLEERLAELSQEGDVAVHYLRPSRSDLPPGTRGGQGEASLNRLEVSADDSSFILAVSPSFPGEHAFEVQDNQGRTVRTAGKVEPDPDVPYLPIPLSTARLPAGQYRLLVSRPGDPDSPAVYPFELIYRD